MSRFLSFSFLVLLWSACASAQTGVTWTRVDTLVPNVSKATVFYIHDRNAGTGLPPLWNLTPSRLPNPVINDPGLDVWHTIHPRTVLNIPSNAVALLVSGSLVTSGLMDERSHCAIVVAVKQPGTTMTAANYNAAVTTPGVPVEALQVANAPAGSGVYLQAAGEREAATFIVPMKDGAFQLAWAFQDARCAMIANFDVDVVYLPTGEPAGPPIIALKHW